jgi:hypothetical protein
MTFQRHIEPHYEDGTRVFWFNDYAERMLMKEGKNPEELINQWNSTLHKYEVCTEDEIPEYIIDIHRIDLKKDFTQIDCDQETYIFSFDPNQQNLMDFIKKHEKDIPEILYVKADGMREIALKHLLGRILQTKGSHTLDWYVGKMSSTTKKIKEIRESYNTSKMRLASVGTGRFTSQPEQKVLKCKYCGMSTTSQDPDVLCKDCQRVFGHTLYSEL